MDELADDLSCAMIDVPQDAHCSNTQIRRKSDSIRLNHQRASYRNNHSISYCRNRRGESNINTMSSHDGSCINPSTSGVANAHSRATKSAKSIVRCASILLRSKGLILSDSDSESGSNNKEKEEPNGASLGLLSVPRKQRMKKQKRKTEKKENQLCIPSPNYNQYFGKRKRSTSLFNTNLDDPSTSGDKKGFDSESRQQKMDCDSQSYDSSSLSESVYSSDQFFDADDEQSDFYEVMTRTSASSNPVGKVNESGKHPKGSSKIKYQQSIPIPKNPFASVPSTPSSSCNSGSCLSSALIWKRRRKNH